MPAKKKLPDFATDEEAEDFVATADLSEYDLADFVVSPIRFVDPPPNTFVPDGLLVKVRDRAKHEGVSPDRFIERVLEHALSEPPK